ncbi:MAG: hypothetical protein ACUVXI_16635 [bacterium]
MENEFNNLGTRVGFNRALRHFRKVTDILGLMERGANLADLVNELVEKKEIYNEQVAPILNAVLVDKFDYAYKSLNIPITLREFDKITEEVGRWTAMDLVLSYAHPQLGLSLINPKNPNHWERVSELKENELLVVYARYIGSEAKDGRALAESSIESFKELLQGNYEIRNDDYIDHQVKARKIERKEVVVKRMTPRYSVQVTNELFHNGNVEAWKNIIESFKATHPDLEVFVYHGGELIHDINSLFKWGKVKHGDSIFFSIGGDNIRDVSKLQRYLFEGASHRFEAFLKKDVNRVINLVW